MFFDQKNGIRSNELISLLVRSIFQPDLHFEKTLHQFLHMLKASIRFLNPDLPILDFGLSTNIHLQNYLQISEEM